MLSRIKQAPLLQLFSGKIEVVGVKSMDSKLTLRLIMSSLTHPTKAWVEGARSQEQQALQQ